MLAETAKTLKLGAVIQVSLGGRLDGIKCICNGPLVLMDGDKGEVIHDSLFPTHTGGYDEKTWKPKVELVRKYVVRFPDLGGMRMLLGPQELEGPFELIKQGDREAPPPPGPVGA